MEQSAQRRLVKSPPELWAEVSSEDALGRHLASFGEIRITRVVPETTVAWEGDRASGTVQLVAGGWGTKVVLTATPAEPPGLAGGAGGSPHAAELERVFFARSLPPRRPAPLAPAETTEILNEVLDVLGAAHHRPLSRG